MPISSLAPASPTTSLPTPEAIVQQFSAPASLRQSISDTRRQINAILNGLDPRLLLICGPCSIHDVDAAIEYAEKLRQLSLEVADRFLLVMRVHFDKPRTILGWPGFATDPHLDGSNDIATGVSLTRQLLLRLAQARVPAAAELLTPLSVHYFGDLLAWACIGARTAESQIHRQIAAAVPMPVAFKNTTSGNVHAAIHGVIAAAARHTFMGISPSGQLATITAEGNPNAHIVLRGSEERSNYDVQSIHLALELLKQAQLPQRLLVDCAHGNSRRQHLAQIDVFRSVLAQVAEGNGAIRGLILESHLRDGRQTYAIGSGPLKYGISITDPCLGWQDTEQLIRWGYDALYQTISHAS